MAALARPAELVSLVEQIRGVVAEMDAEADARADECGPTYFELTTLMALLEFAQKEVQAAVLEVGLGRPSRFDQRLPPGSGRYHQHQLRSHQAARKHAGGDRRGESRNYQARRANCLGRDGGRAAGRD